MRKDESKFITNFFSESGTKKLNNDYFGYLCLENVGIWVIADGYDEDERGNVASKIVVEKIVEHFILNPIFSYKNLKDMINYANFCIQEKQKELNFETLMQCSVSVILTNYHSYLYGGVGNCRLYHFREGYLISQSSDDTIAQTLVDEGYLNIENIRIHRQRNDLLQSLGDSLKLKINITKKPIELRKKDSLVLATIGFWEKIDERELEKEIFDYENRKNLIFKLKNKIQFSEEIEIENNSFVIIDILEIASSEKIDDKNFKKNIFVVILVIFFSILMLNFYFWIEGMKIEKKINYYEEKISNDLENKNFNNVTEFLSLEKLEYEKLLRGTKGIIGFLSFGDGRKESSYRELETIKLKMDSINKIKAAFENINRGNEFFRDDNYDEAYFSYSKAKYILDENEYAKDELGQEELLLNIKERLISIENLKNSKNLEIIGDNAFKIGNYKLALEKYKEIIGVYLKNGKENEIEKFQNKIREIEDKEARFHNEAILNENQGKLFFYSNLEMAREAFVKTRGIYQVLGDEEKVKEIDNKLLEINLKEMEEKKKANDKLEIALEDIMSGNVSRGVSKLGEIKRIYNNIGDKTGEASIDGFIEKAKDYILIEERNKNKLEIEKVENNLKLELKTEEIKREKEKLESITKELEEITNLEIQGEKLLLLKKYGESIIKYEEAKKIFLNLKNKFMFDDKKIKENQLDLKIIGIEILLYEVEGDRSYREKNYKEAKRKYKLSIDKINEIELDNFIVDRINKKYDKTLKKINKKWWEIWK